MSIVLKNKKASFNYEFIKTYTAGIKLLGSEVKSIRKNGISFTDSFCFFKDKKLYVKNLYISEYKEASRGNHDPYRDNEILLTKKELKKLMTKQKESGLTIIPVKLFEVNGYFKLDIALAKGKKNFDKRQSIKKKDQKRDLDRITKYN